MREKVGKTGVGKLGEEQACRFLEEAGHVVLERNYRSGHLEIDVITKSTDGLHFVEVKSRTAPCADEPEVKVDRLKKARVTSAALSYLHRAGKGVTGDEEVFFDIVSVVFDGGTVRVKHYPGAWIPLY